MALWDELARYLQDGGFNRRLVLGGSVLLGISSGVLGTFAMLRRQSLLGDALAHAALPGVCLAFLVVGVKDPLVFLVGATITGLIGAGLILLITRKSRIKEDTAIGLILSVSFGVGIVLLTVIQRGGAGNQAGLDTFLFGKAASLLPKDVQVMGIMCVVLLAVVTLFYKEFKILSFDPGFGASLGFPIRFLDVFLTGLIVIAVMVGLQAVGVVLMAAMLILPAAAARPWTDRLGVMLFLAAFTGAFAGALGAFVSAIMPRMPTGPVMVLAAALIMVVSILAAPRRGLIPRILRQWRNDRRINEENLLKAFYHLGERAGDLTRSWGLEQVAIVRGTVFDAFRRTLHRLVRRGHLLQEEEAGYYRLSREGRRAAQRVVRHHRLWELYLARKADIPADHVHRDAEAMEHVLSPALVRQLEKLLQETGTDPHGRPIPPEPEPAGVGP